MDRATAEFCAAHGAGAVGLVFYPPSPRALTIGKAKAVVQGLPPEVARVGVFVDMQTEKIREIAEKVGLTSVQLHGSESNAAVQILLDTGLHVIRVLRNKGDLLQKEACMVPSCAGILVECGESFMPGGTGTAWEWQEAAVLHGLRPFAIAGGLTPDNLSLAAGQSLATAWDLSSGVEISPGQKDHNKIRQVLQVAGDLFRSSVNFWHSVSNI